MRIQAINNNYNQNNISHKAHFKSNVYLEEICKNVEKTEHLPKVLNLFQRTLPKHELEIIEKIQNKKNVIIGYVVRNNTTHKKNEYLAVEGKNALLSLLTAIVALRSGDSFWKKDYCEKLDCYSFITDTNYETIEDPAVTFQKNLKRIADDFTKKEE